MKKKKDVPNTPFSTRLSGSAKETELRLRSIFQWKKKRPPVILFALVAVLMLGICGGLVGFSDQQTDERYLATLEVSGAKIFAKRQGLRSFEVYWQPDGGMPECFSTVTRAKVSTVQLTEHNGKLAVRYTDSYNDLSCIYVYVLSDDKAPVYLIGGASDPDKLLPEEAPGIEETLGLVPPNSNKEPDPEPVEAPESVEPEHKQVERQGLTLDEIGTEDDSLILTIYRDKDGPTGQVEVFVQLGSGKTLFKDLSNEVSHYVSPELQAAYLTSVTRQSVVMKLDSIASTYGAAQYYVVEVIDDALVVTDLSADRQTLYDFSFAYHPVTGLAHVRISVLGGEITLGWKDGAWNEVTVDPAAGTHTVPEPEATPVPEPDEPAEQTPPAEPTESFPADPGFVRLTFADGTQREGWSSPDNVEVEMVPKGGWWLNFHVAEEELEWAASVEFQKATVRFGGSEWEHPGDVFFSAEYKVFKFCPTASGMLASYPRYGGEIRRFYDRANEIAVTPEE